MFIYLEKTLINALNAVLAPSVIYTLRLEGTGMSLNELHSDEPFSYRETKGGLVHISYKGKSVTTLSGKNSPRFLAKVGLGNLQSE